LREWTIDSEEVIESSLSDDTRESQREERELQNEEDNQMKRTEVHNLIPNDNSLIDDHSETLPNSETKNQHQEYEHKHKHKQEQEKEQEQEQEQEQQQQKRMDSIESEFFIDMTAPLIPRTRVLSSFRTLRYCSFFNLGIYPLTL
jgi:uncharacterized membrane protein